MSQARPHLWAFLPFVEAAMNKAYNENHTDFRRTSTSAPSANFDSRTKAPLAVGRLQVIGIAQVSIHIPANILDDCNGSPRGTASMSFWDQVESWLLPDGGPAAYSEHPHGCFSCVGHRCRSRPVPTARTICGDQGSIDIDERADQWRQEGWSCKRRPS